MLTLELKNWKKFNLSVIGESKILPAWKYPKTIDPIEKLFDLAYKNNFPESKRKFICEFNNVYINNGKIINSDYTEEVKEFSTCGDLYVKSKNKNVKIVDNAIHLIDKWGGTNYWHWMSSCFSKLYLINKPYEDYFFLINSLSNSFVRDSLKMVNIPFNKCIEIDKEKIVFCKNLLAPGPIGDRDKEGFLFIRKLFKTEKFHNKNLLITRKTTRKIINQKEINDVLNELGLNFEQIYCEDFSFNDQVEIFSNANLIISPHGAGLTNLIFAPDDVKILEIRSPDYFGSCYWKLSNFLNFDYFSLIGVGDFPKTISDLTRNLNSNIFVDIEKFKKTLEIML